MEVDKSGIFPPRIAASLVGVLDPLADDMQLLIGKRPEEVNEIKMSERLLEIAQEARVHPFDLNRWMFNILGLQKDGTYGPTPSLTPAKIQLRYLSEYRNPPNGMIEDNIASALDNYPELQGLILDSAASYPLFSNLTADLYRGLKVNPEYTGKKKRKRTPYEITTEAVLDSNNAIKSVISKLRERQTSVSGNQLTDLFLIDLGKALQLHVFEVLNMANSHTIDQMYQQRNSISLHSIPVGVSYSEFYDASNEIRKYKDLVLPDGRTSYLSTVGDYSFKKNDSLTPDQKLVYVPILVSNYDTMRYAQLLRTRLVQFDRSVDKFSTFSDTSRDPQSSGIQFDRENSLFVRPFPKFENGRQITEARINFQLSDFSIRADCDYRRRMLSLDFGGFKIDDALRLMEGYHAVDEQRPLIDVLSDRKKFDQFFKDFGFGPSFMDPYGEKGLENGWEDPFSDATKMAFMASAIASEGESVAMRRSSDRFSYHTRDFINRSEYLDNFPLIAYSLVQSLTTAMR